MPLVLVGTGMGTKGIFFIPLLNSKTNHLERKEAQKGNEEPN